MCRVFPKRAHRAVASSIVHAGQCERNAREGQRSPADRNIGEGQAFTPVARQNLTTSEELRAETVGMS